MLKFDYATLQKVCAATKMVDHITPLLQHLTTPPLSQKEVEELMDLLHHKHCLSEELRHHSRIPTGATPAVKQALENATAKLETFLKEHNL